MNSAVNKTISSGGSIEHSHFNERNSQSVVKDARSFCWLATVEKNVSIFSCDIDK